MRLDAAACYRASAVIGIDLSAASLWEFAALVGGWNEAHSPEDPSAGIEPMSDEEFERLKAEIG